MPRVQANDLRLDGTLAHVSPQTAHDIALWVLGSKDAAEEYRSWAEDRIRK